MPPLSYNVFVKNQLKNVLSDTEIRLSWHE